MTALVKELLALTEGKDVMHPWTEAMLAIVKTASPKVAKEITGIDGSEGTETPIATGKKIVEAFKAAKGYKPFEQIDDFWVIEALKNPGVGISVDFRKDMDFSAGKCHVMFYDEDM